MTVDGLVRQFAIPSLDPDSQVITPGPDGRLWFTEFNTRKIGRIALDGAIVEFPAPR